MKDGLRFKTYAKFQRALIDVEVECQRQDEKWGENRKHPMKPEIDFDSGQEFQRISDLRANLSRIECDIAFAENQGTWFHILSEEFWEVFASKTEAEMRVELVQVAAVVFQMIRNIDFNASETTKARKE